MALTKVHCISKIGSKWMPILSSPSIKKCHWFPAFKPGKVPVTQEEKEAAAKKYNMLVEEYEPDNDSVGAGDYPSLPFESVDSRDPYYPWDFPGSRRDYLEPFHRDQALLEPEWTTTLPPKRSYARSWTVVLTFYFICCIIIYINSKFVFFAPLSKKQLILSGEPVRYTFELDYEELERRKSKCECPPEN